MGCVLFLQDTIHDRILSFKVNRKIDRYATIDDIDKTVIDELVATVSIQFERQRVDRVCLLIVAITDNDQDSIGRPLQEALFYRNSRR